MYDGTAKTNGDIAAEAPTDTTGMDYDEAEWSKYMCIEDALALYSKSNNYNNVIMDEDEDENDYDYGLGRVDSSSPGRNQIMNSVKKSRSPLRLRSNSRMNGQQSNIKNSSHDPLNTSEVSKTDETVANADVRNEYDDADTSKYADNDRSNVSMDNSEGGKNPKLLSKSKNKKKKTKSVQPIPSLLKKSTKAYRDYIRDTRRIEDMQNMDDLVMKMKNSRRENAGDRKLKIPKLNGRNPKLIRRKDIKLYPGKKGINGSFSQSKRKIIRQQGITRKN